MADWDKIKSRGRVSDRRGSPASFGGLPGMSNIGLVGVVAIIGLSLLTGGEVNVADVLGQLEKASVSQQTNVDTSQFAGEDEYEVFASTVVGSNNAMWEQLFSDAGQQYTDPELVLFRGSTRSGCGVASSAIGPHYCPADETIYIDETFFDELTRRFGAEGGDVAEAYVISHEVAHHVQNLLGTSDMVNAARGTSKQNEQSVNQELQADCYAGLWANSIKDLGVFEAGEIREALSAAAAVGDDRIQEKTSGRIDPESWTHGSSEQRVGWFNEGFENGSVAGCDTFN